MKQLIVNLVAVMIIAFGGFYLLEPIDAAPIKPVEVAGTCVSEGCLGGDLKCYSPPDGGMCYTHPVVVVTPPAPTKN
jgi:hypothetical protein